MKSLNVLAGALVVLALTAGTPVRAQDRPQGGGGGGVHGGGGGMGAAGGGGTHGVAGSGGTSGVSGGFSGGSSSQPSGGTSGGFSGGSGSTGGSTYSGPSPMGGTRSAVADRGTRSAAGGAMLRGTSSRDAASADPGNAAIPGGARPNYGNANRGTAVPRGTANTGGGGIDPGINQPASPYDNPSFYWWYYGSSALWDLNYPYGAIGYGCTPGSPVNCYLSRYLYNPFFMYGYGAFGLGSFYYDPAWWGTGFGWYGSDASNYPLTMDSGAAGGAGGWSDDEDDPATTGPKGALKLKITPKTAEVYVDGYYMGLVTDYDGAFQRLNLPAGQHHLEIRAPGYQPLGFDVNIEARDTISYHGVMQPLQPVK